MAESSCWTSLKLLSINCRMSGDDCAKSHVGQMTLKWDALRALQHSHLAAGAVVHSDLKTEVHATSRLKAQLWELSDVLPDFRADFCYVCSGVKTAFLAVPLFPVFTPTVLVLRDSSSIKRPRSITHTFHVVPKVLYLYVPPRPCRTALDLLQHWRWSRRIVRYLGLQCQSLGATQLS
jgi:hypothetical protein